MHRSVLPSLAVLLWLSGCSERPAPRTWPDLTQLGRRCGDAGPCPEGLRCLEAGSFAHVSHDSTCELVCDAYAPSLEQRGCPEGMACVIVADGRGEEAPHCEPDDFPE